MPAMPGSAGPDHAGGDLAMALVLGTPDQLQDWSSKSSSLPRSARAVTLPPLSELALVPDTPEVLVGPLAVTAVDIERSRGDDRLVASDHGFWHQPAYRADVVLLLQVALRVAHQSTSTRRFGSTVKVPYSPFFS